MQPLERPEEQGASVGLVNWLAVVVVAAADSGYKETDCAFVVTNRRPGEQGRTPCQASAAAEAEKRSSSRSVKVAASELLVRPVVPWLRPKLLLSDSEQAAARTY